jgi:hypothetical protein
MIPEKVEEVNQFIEETQDLPGKVIPGIGIQMSQSFHSRKAKFAPKDLIGRVRGTPV